MALSFSITPGYSFSDSEKVTYTKLNLLGTPVITMDGQAESGEIADGAVTTAKLASTVDINSKTADHNIALTKLASGTQGQILYYDANGDLVTLTPGTSGTFLKTNGAGANPEWAAQAGISTIAISQITTSGANKFISTDGSGTIQWETKGDTYKFCEIWDQKSTNTAAGASTTSATARDLTNKTDPDGVATLSSNQITLVAGDYAVDALVSYNSACDRVTAWLYDTTGAATLVNGGSVWCPNSNDENGFIPIRGRFTLGATSTLEVRQQAASAVATYGWGKAANIGSQPEIYTMVRITKIT